MAPRALRGVDPLTLGIGALVVWALFFRDGSGDGGTEPLAIPSTPATGGLPEVDIIPAVPVAPIVPTPIPAAPAPKPAGSNVPNISGDPLGYDSSMFPDFQSIRATGRALGYLTATQRSGAGTLATTGEPWVERFQRDYNATYTAPGYLLVDGIPGMWTLRAMGWVNQPGRRVQWAQLHEGVP